MIAQGRGKDSEGTRIAASPFTVMDTYSALWLINAIIVLRLEFKYKRLKHFLEGYLYDGKNRRLRSPARSLKSAPCLHSFSS